MWEVKVSNIKADESTKRKLLLLLAGKLDCSEDSLTFFFNDANCPNPPLSDITIPTMQEYEVKAA